MSGTMSGGERLQEVLRQYAANLASAGDAPEVRVGFLADAKYPSGVTKNRAGKTVVHHGESVASIAALNEFGGTINRPPGTVTVYRKVAASGTHFLRNGRFVKRKEANFSTTHAHAGYSITIPPRPFFRNMIRQYHSTWGPEIATQLRITKMNARLSLQRIGMLIEGQLRQSIVDTNTSPNAPSTIARKGFNDPLIDTGYMLNSVDSEVSGA